MLFGGITRDQFCLDRRLGSPRDRPIPGCRGDPVGPETNQIDSNKTGLTNRWPAFRDLVVGLGLKDSAAVCEAPLADIENIAAFCTVADHAATIIGCGLQRHRLGGENVRFINELTSG
jgi:hypothetical protein